MERIGIGTGKWSRLTLRILFRIHDLTRLVGFPLEFALAPFRKSRFLTFCGWMALICIAISFGVPLFEVVTQIRVPRTVWPGFAFIAFWPFFLIWCVGTMIHRSRIRRARIQAEAFAEVAQRTSRTIK